MVAGRVEVVDGVFERPGRGVVVLGRDEDVPVVGGDGGSPGLVCSPAYWPMLGGMASSMWGGDAGAGR